jgi:uncharacterized protein
MEFFCYHRDRPGSVPLRMRLREAHWSYMDRFAATMIARGPTFTADDELLGSVHLLDLPDVAAARAFVFDEPTWQAGAYRDVLLRRFRRALASPATDGDGFLVLGLGEGPGADTTPPEINGQFVAYGSLTSDDGAAWLGTVAIVQGIDAGSARKLLTAERYASVEVQPWTPGGRR